MLVPVVFMVVMLICTTSIRRLEVVLFYSAGTHTAHSYDETKVFRGAHSLKAELVNGTATITIEDLDKACGSSRLMRHDKPTKMDGLRHEISLEEDPSRDTESLFRSMLEILCPYVGYFPVIDPTEKEETTTKKDAFKSEYHVDDKTTKTTLSYIYSNISDTTESRYDLTNSTSKLILTTETTIRPTNKSGDMIADIKLDSHESHENVTDSILSIEIESTLSIPKDKYNSSVDKKPENITERTTTTTLHKPDKIKKNTTTGTLDKRDEIMENTTTTPLHKPDKIRENTTTKTLDKPDKIMENTTTTTLDKPDKIMENITTTTLHKPDEITENTTMTTLHKLDKIMESTTTTTLDKPETLTILKNTTSDMEMTEITLDDSSFKDTTYNSSIDETSRNSTINDTVILGTETTKKPLNDIFIKHKHDLIEEVENSTKVTSTPKSITPKPNNVSTISTTKYKTEESAMEENMTSTSPIGKITNKSDILKHKMNTYDSDIESTSTVHFIKKISEVDVSITTLSYSKTTEEVAVDEKDPESKNNTEVNELLVPAFGEDDNTSDSRIVLDTTESFVKSTSFKSDEILEPTEDFEDSLGEDTDESSISYYNKHTNDELIVVDVRTESTSTKFDEEPTVTINNDRTDDDKDLEEKYDDDKEIFKGNTDESKKEIEVTHETTNTVEEETKSDGSKNNPKKKLTYEHDTNAVDERRKIVVILFVSILLALSLIWAVKFLYRRHKGSYVLPRDGGNDMELGDNSTDNSNK